MNYNSKGYSRIKEAQKQREDYILKVISQKGFYSTTYIFSCAELNAVDRLKKKGLIIWNEEKWGYIKV